MNTYRSIAVAFAFCVPLLCTAQFTDLVSDLNFSLEPLEDQETWGVYVIPGPSIQPSKRATTGTGQVTLVASLDFYYTNFQNHAGTWEENARVNGPMEAPDHAYVSFGFVVDEPRVKLISSEKTLLFSFVPTTYEAKFSLFDNVNDPFATPNTYGTNPGNDLGIIDFDSDNNLVAYGYGKNLENRNSPAPVLTKLPGTQGTQHPFGEAKAVLASEKTINTGHTGLQKKSVE